MYTETYTETLKKQKPHIEWGSAVFLGGEGGIRTLGTFDSTPDFESGTFDHSATSPNQTTIIASHSRKPA